MNAVPFRITRAHAGLVGCVILLALAACQSSQVVSAPNTLAAPTASPSAPLPAPTATPAASFKLLARLGESIVTQIAWTPDGKFFAVASSTGITLYDAQTRQPLRAFDRRAWIARVMFSPDGTRLAAIQCPEENCAAGAVELWDVASGKPIRALTGVTASDLIAFGADGKSLVTGTTARAQIWNLDTGQPLRTFEGGLLAVSADRRMIVFGASAPQLWNLATDAAMPLPGKIFADAAAFSPNGQTLALGDSAGVQILAIGSARVLQTLSDVSFVRKIAYSPDGKWLAVSGTDRNGRAKLWLWDAVLKLVRAFDIAGSVLDFAISPDSRLLAFSASARAIITQEIASGKTRFTFEGHRGQIHRLAFSADNRTLVSDDQWNTTRLWDVETGSALATFNSARPTARQALLTANASRVITWDVGTATELWKLREAERVATLEPGQTQEGARTWARVATSSDGRFVASAASDGSSITLRDATTGNAIRKLEGHTGQILSLVFSRDGKLLASTGVKSFTGSGPAANSDLRVWNVETGALVSTRDSYPWSTALRAFASEQIVLSTQSIFDSCGRGNQFRLAGWDVALPANSEPRWQLREPGIEFFTITPDQRIAAVVAQDKACLRGNATVVVLDSQTGNLLATLANPNAFASSLALDPNGARVAVGIDSPRVGVQVWDVRASALQFALPDVTSRATQLAFSPDGNWLAAGHADGTLKVWDARAGVLRQTLAGHTASVATIRFSADQRLLVSAGNDGWVQVWERQ